MHSSPPRLARVTPAVLLPLLAVIVIAPLMTHGVSCGHDFDFHLESWLDAAAQMRHGTLDPSWTISAAWNAGEPRFLFYPPLSWMLGALLALVMPLSAAPVVFTCVALLAAGTAMYTLARDFVSQPAALLATAVYVASPYMLFTAFERTAYGELLAAAWLPLLMLAALREAPSVAGIAIPIALLWLTNAPAAVIGVYMLVFIASVRVLQTIGKRSNAAVRMLLLHYIAGGALGLALAAFYLIPAAYERRYVQVAMAIIPNMRVDDNFLFGHTGDAPHDRVLHTASLIAVAMLAATVLAFILTVMLRTKRRPPDERINGFHQRTPLVVLAAFIVAIAFLLTPISLPLWRHLPELVFLQFPWRLLSVLGIVLALTLALALRFVRSTPASLASASLVTILFVGAMTAWQIRNFRQPCEALDQPSTRAQLFATHHGAEPTDEYTPTDADNDVLRWDAPGYWLASTPDGFAANTVPNPAATIVNYDAPPPIEQTISGVAPHHLQLALATREILILNLRDYPSWQIFRNGVLVTQHLQRDDGLLAVALPAGTSVIDVRWHRTWDQLLGDLVSILALLVLGTLLVRSRTIKA